MRVRALDSSLFPQFRQLHLQLHFHCIFLPLFFSLLALAEASKVYIFFLGSACVFSAFHGTISSRERASRRAEPVDLKSLPFFYFFCSFAR